MTNPDKRKVASHKESILAVTLKAQIKAKMEAIGTNVRALERKAGLNIGAVNNILNGTSANPTAETLSALANAFDCTVDDLLGRQARQISNSSADKFNDFKTFAWSHSLYTSIAEELNNQLNKKQVAIPSSKALYIISEVYLYLLKKNKDTVDSSLVEWLLDKTL